MAAALCSAPLVCKVCSSPVPNPTNRRKLSSAASGRVAETLSEICDKLRICSDNLRGQRSFLCRPCFRMIEKLVNLRNQTLEVQAKIEIKFEVIFLKIYFFQCTIIFLLGRFAIFIW